MSRNEHLLDKFLVSDETRTLGSHILRTVQVKTGPGSGRELRELRGGLPAAAILVACERLNTTEVTTKSAQNASCLKPKDFKKVYGTVRDILEENERAISLPQADPPETPLRRSARTTVSLYGTSTSPMKSSVPLPWKKTPKRELPSKDSPRKGARDQGNVLPDDVPETPSKRRRLESPSKSAGPIFPSQSSPSRSVPEQSPLKASLSTARTKRKYAATLDVATSEDDGEGDSEEPAAKGRFRPVYLEHWQWVAGDPRVASIWKKAEKFKARSFERRFVLNSNT